MPRWATTFASTLVDLLQADTKGPNDFGRGILPKLAGKAPVYAYNFETNSRAEITESAIETVHSQLACN